jgi:hypothetical protein
MSVQEWWAYFFRHGADKSKLRLINEILAVEEGIAMAGKVVQGFTKHELEVFHQISKDKWYLDRQSQLAHAREAGRKEREAAEKRARKAGLKAGREEVARKALNEGASVEFVQKITGLDINTITGLLQK